MNITDFLRGQFSISAHPAAIPEELLVLCALHLNLDVHSVLMVLPLASDLLAQLFDLLLSQLKRKISILDAVLTPLEDSAELRPFPAHSLGLSHQNLIFLGSPFISSEIGVDIIHPSLPHLFGGPKVRAYLFLK